MELEIAKNFEVDPWYVVTGRTAIIGQSGSGKSYLVSVICEELARNDLGFVVIDTEGEYSGLHKFEDIQLIDDIEDIFTNEERIQAIIEESQRIVLDVSESEDYVKKVEKFLESLYRVATKLFREGPHRPIPFLLIIEEADQYIPQRDGKPLEIVQTISRRGRKRGLGILLATQRPALVNKNVLSQCNNVFIGKLTLKNDLDSVRIFFSSMDELRRLTTLEQGNFYVQGAIAEPTFIKIKTRETPHGGSTPRIKAHRTSENSESYTNSEAYKSKQNYNDEVARIQRAVASTNSGKSVKCIDYDVTQVTDEIIKNKRKKLKIIGKLETIDDEIKKEMFPIFRLQIQQIKRRFKILSNKFDTYTVLVDGDTGNILNKQGNACSKNLKCLFDLSERELRLMDFILSEREVSKSTLKEKRPIGLESGLKRLKEVHLITKIDDCYVSLHDIKYPQSLKPQNIDFLKLKEEKAPTIKHPKVSKSKLENLIRGLYQGCTVMNTDLVYLPLFKVNYINGDNKRTLQIKASFRK